MEKVRCNGWVGDGGTTCFIRKRPYATTTASKLSLSVVITDLCNPKIQVYRPYLTKKGDDCHIKRNRNFLRFL